MTPRPKPWAGGAGDGEMGDFLPLFSASRQWGALKHEVSPFSPPRARMHSCSELGTQARGGARGGEPPSAPGRGPNFPPRSSRAGEEESKVGKGRPEARALGAP